MNSHTACLVKVALLVSLGLVGCTSPQPTDQTVRHQASPLLQADLTSHRITGREQIRLPGQRVLYADKISRRADGTVLASGRVYVDGGVNSGAKPVGGWPRHMYAKDARWCPTTKMLELSGHPILEYDKCRIVASSRETTAVFTGEKLKIKGQTSSLLNGSLP